MVVGTWAHESNQKRCQSSFNLSPTSILPVALGYVHSHPHDLSATHRYKQDRNILQFGELFKRLFLIINRRDHTNSCVCSVKHTPQSWRMQQLASILSWSLPTWQPFLFLRKLKIGKTNHIVSKQIYKIFDKYDSCEHVA